LYLLRLHHFLTLETFVDDLNQIWEAMSKSVADFIPTRLRVSNKLHRREIWHAIPVATGGIDLSIYRCREKKRDASTVRQT
jgi:hypothetical protein